MNMEALGRFMFNMMNGQGSTPEQFVQTRNGARNNSDF
jgi:hypothetical protein